MIKSTAKILPDQTAQLEITISWDEVKKSYDQIFDAVAKKTEIPGFRKGKAPKKLLEEKIDRKKIYEETVKEIIPQAYQKALSEHNLKPFSTPKIKIEKAKENEDWSIKAQVALKPRIDLKNYKEKIRELKKSKVKIWTPGQSDESDEKEKEKVSLDEIITTLLNEIEVVLSSQLLEEETNRFLTQLIDQTQKLGLTIEQYLSSKGITVEKLKEDYRRQAEKNLKTQLILAEIAEKENIAITQEEIDRFIEKMDKPEDKQEAKKNSYYLAFLLRQQKTLEFLVSL